MANIDEYIKQIQQAQYGEEVRGSIVNALKKVNDDNNSYVAIKKEVVAAKDIVEEKAEIFDEKANAAKETLTALQASTQIANEAKSSLNNIISSAISTKKELEQAVLETGEVIARVDNAKSNLDKLITSAGKAELNLQRQIETSNQIKNQLDVSNNTAIELKKNLDVAINEANTAKVKLVEAINNAGNAALEKIETAQSVATRAVETAKVEAVKAITTAGTTETKKVTDEGAKQVQTVQSIGTQETEKVTAEGTKQVGLVKTEGEKHLASVQTAAQEIIADREQINTNKEGVAKLKEDLGDKSNLNTDNKTNVVNAINEVNNRFLSPVAESVTNWLDNHPEATTTVQDGSITKQKFTSSTVDWINGVIVCPSDFGATGDGATDDTEAIQSCLNFADTYGCVTVWFKTGTYLVKKLSLYPNTKLIGGQDVKLLRHRDSYGILFPNFDNLYPKHNGGEVYIENIEFNGNVMTDDVAGKFKWGDMIALAHLLRLTIKNCDFVNGANGEHVIDCCGNDNVLIEGCTFRGVLCDGNLTEVVQIDITHEGSFSGVIADDTPTENCIIRNCVFKPNTEEHPLSKMCVPIGAHTCIQDHPYKNITIENCEFYDVIGNTMNNGITIHYSENLIIRNNLFDYSNITLSYSIIGLSNNFGCKPIHKNALIENNKIKLTNCVVGSHYAIIHNSSGNRYNQGYYSDGVKIIGNDFGELRVNLLGMDNVRFEKNILSTLNLSYGKNNIVYGNTLKDGGIQDQENLVFERNTVNNSSVISNVLYSILKFNGKQLHSIIKDNEFDYSGETSGVYMLGFNTDDTVFIIENNKFTGCGVIRNNDYITYSGSGWVIKDNICDSLSEIKIGNISANIYGNNFKSSVNVNNSHVVNNVCGAISGANSIFENNIIENCDKIKIKAKSQYIGNLFKNLTNADRWVYLYYGECDTVEKSVVFMNNIFINENGTQPKYFIEAMPVKSGINTAQYFYTSNNIYLSNPLTSYEKLTKSGLWLNNGLKKYLANVDNSGSIVVAEIIES